MRARALLILLRAIVPLCAIVPIVIGVGRPQSTRFVRGAGRGRCRRRAERAATTTAVDGGARCRRARWLLLLLAMGRRNRIVIDGLQILRLNLVVVVG